MPHFPNAGEAWAVSRARRRAVVLALGQTLQGAVPGAVPGAAPPDGLRARSGLTPGQLSVVVMIPGPASQDLPAQGTIWGSLDFGSLYFVRFSHETLRKLLGFSSQHLDHQALDPLSSRGWNGGGFRCSCGL